jgi:hypothetical protein
LLLLPDPNLHHGSGSSVFPRLSESPMDLSVTARPLAAEAAYCAGCGHSLALPLPARAARTAARSYRGAWFVLACLFAFGLLWSGRYEYALCDVDGCLRVDRWSSRVDWIGADIPELRVGTHSVQARAAGRSAAVRLTSRGAR